MSKKFDECIKKATDFLKKGMMIEALSEYQKALMDTPRSIQALDGIATIYNSIGKPINAYRALNRIIELYGDDTPIPLRVRFFEMAKNNLFWEHLEREYAYFSKPDVLNSGRINPFIIGIQLPLTNQQRLQALRQFVKSTPELQLKMCPFSFDDRPKKPKKLKLGFVSADFRRHPSGFVIGEFFELINRDKFDVYLYDVHPEPDTYPSKRIYKTTSNVIALDKLNDLEAAQRIHQDKIDVLIDLNGFTTFNRLGIMTYQPAPAQGTFLGCIGTLAGVPGIDYHFVDKYSILDGEEKYYHEELKYLEPVRWLIDHKIELPQHPPLRKHLGFKKDTVVLCCFNNTFKFTPNYFDLWSRILKRAEKAVLWFYGGSAILEENIKNEFKKRGIEADRIIMSGFVPHMEHMSRYMIADLLLDTEACNAHTTGMEALYMGCPLITCPNRTYPGRVGGALLTALEIPEMICKDIQEYEDKAVDLCNNPEKLKELKTKVKEKAKTAPLFNTELFTRSFEKACIEMYEESIENY